MNFTLKKGEKGEAANAASLFSLNTRLVSQKERSGRLCSEPSDLRGQPA